MLSGHPLAQIGEDIIEKLWIARGLNQTIEFETQSIEGSAVSHLIRRHEIDAIDEGRDGCRPHAVKQFFHLTYIL